MIRKTTHDNPRRTPRIQTINEEKSRTQQQFKDEVNVNNIMKKYRKTGQITHLNNRTGKYADLSNAQDYFESIQTIRTASEAFDQLPSELRKRFHNEPAEMLQFINDPKNYDEGVKLGLFNPKLPPLNTSPAPTNKTNDDLNDEQNTSPAPITKKTKNN